MEDQVCITIDILDDSAVEGDEQFIFQLSNPQNASLSGPDTITIIIIDDGELRAPLGRFEDYW